MVRPTPREAAVDPEVEAAAVPPPEVPAGTPTPAAASALGGLSDLPVAGLTRRRIAMLLGALVAAWVIVLFARQVGEATEATARASAMRTENARLEAEVAALQAELVLIQRQAYIEQAAREYRLGRPREVPFVIAEDAPTLGADAPGSAAVRLGTTVARPTPLESWARLLFGADPAATSPPAGPESPPAD